MKPILFSGPMVRAILDGRKTMTRRVIRPDVMQRGTNWHWNPNENLLLAPYRPGDILWVREKWRAVDYEYCDGKWSASIEYADVTKGPRVFWYDNSDVGIPDDCIYGKTGWRPSIFMPREAARIFLRVTGVKVERVQEISEEDAVLEGFYRGWRSTETSSHAMSAKQAFMWTWDMLNAKRADGIYSWANNPYVWAYTFERISTEEANATQHTP